MHLFNQKANRPLLKNKFISGTIILTATGCISRFIGFYYKVFLSRTIGAEALGIYQLVFSVFSLMVCISSAGIQTAISRSVAGSKTGRQQKGYLFAGLSVSLLLSLFCMILIRTRAGWLCHIMMDDSDGSELLHLMSLAIPFANIHSCINGYYYGCKKTAVPALSQLIEQISRVSAVFLIWQISLSGGTFFLLRGVIWGIFIGEFAAVLYCTSAILFTQKNLHISIQVFIAQPIPP